MDSSLTWRRLVLMASLLSLVVYMVDSYSSGHRQQHHETCNKSKKCDFTKWLRCQEAKCVCFDPDELFYEQASKRCVGRAGTNCSRQFYTFDEDPFLFHIRGATANHWRYGNSTLRCGTNAFCAYDPQINAHFCKCDKNYYDADDGTCLRLKGHGDTCQQHKECDPDLFIRCIHGSCQCEKELRNFNKDLNKCVVQAGTPCVSLKNKDDGHLVDDCPIYSICLDGVCKCRFGTQIHSDKTCQRGYGQECGPDHPCGDSLLTCRAKVCQCKFSLHQEYNEQVGECLSLTSGPCSLNDTSVYALNCTMNAECVQRGLRSECACKKGFLQTKNGECVKPFGSDCKVDNECDRVNPLACINNKCDCLDQLEYFKPTTRKCLGVVGSRCKLDEDEPCIDNASCSRYEEESYGTIGRCVCNNGLTETVNRTCSR